MNVDDIITLVLFFYRREFLLVQYLPRTCTCIRKPERSMENIFIEMITELTFMRKKQSKTRRFNVKNRSKH